MAVAYDGEVIQQNSFGPATSFTLTGQTTAGSNRLGIASTGFLTFASPDNSGVTWNGVAMTLVDQQKDPNGFVASMWYIPAPPTGGSNVVFTYGFAYGYAASIGYNGVDQATSIGTPAKTTYAASPASISVASATGDMVVDVIAEYNSTPVAGAGQTQRFNGNQGGTNFGAGSEKAGAASVTMSWTGSSTFLGSLVGVSLKASGGVIVVPVSPRKALLGVGL